MKEMGGMNCIERMNERMKEGMNETKTNEVNEVT